MPIWPFLAGPSLIIAAALAAFAVLHPAGQGVIDRSAPPPMPAAAPGDPTGRIAAPAPSTAIPPR
jgi:hypothetical protein